MTLTRRAFLNNAVTSSLAMAGFGGLSGALSSLEASAASTSGYRALVCVFLFGGLDNHDTVLPYDQTSYDQFASVRTSLLQAQGNARARTSLLPLTTTDPTQFGSRRFALPPELSGIKSLYDLGNAAIIGNVGPLLQATNRTTFEQESVALPPRLFSHNDQQATWQASAPEGALFGWGGRFADAVLVGNGAPEFSTISSVGDGLFLTGQAAQPYNVEPGGAASFDVLERLGDFGGSGVSMPMRSLLRGESYAGAQLLARDMRAATRQALDANERYNAALASAQPVSTSFPLSPIGQQLRAVAEAISIRGSLQAQRQVFFVGMGGFDTHSGQAGALPALLSALDGAVTAFFAELEQHGLAQDVTLFTASDFGRTLAVNGDGTDHGWGGHQFVVGGSVQGGAIYGDLPPAVIGHEQDSGGGRLIPTLAVEQMAAPLGRWFGLDDTELNGALPNLASFASAPALGFMA